MRLGTQWLSCGWRLFLRNPWLLGGMGLCGSVLVAALWAIPLLGGPLIALLAPIVLASYYLAIDRVSKLSMPLPAILRRAAMLQSPRELFGVFRDERRIVPIAVVSLYCIFVSLLTNMLLWLVAGSSWTKSWTSLGALGWLAILAALLLALVLYFFLAASLVYALPRTFLRDKPLFPEIVRSVRAGMHYVFALSTLLALLLVPLLVAGVMSHSAWWMGYFVALLGNAVALPLVACALYCSYRTVFQSRAPGAGPS
jgi:hypothetical protein